MSPVTIALLGLAGLVMVLAVALTGRAMRGHWWSADDDGDDDMPASGMPTGKTTKRYTL